MAFDYKERQDDLGPAIKSARLARGLTLIELSRIMGSPFVDISLISKYKNGQLRPPPATLVRLAEALHVRLTIDGKCDDASGIDGPDSTKAERPQVIELAARRNVAASPWLTVLEAGRYARCSKKFIYAACAAGKMRHARAGRKIVLKVEWIDVFLEAQNAGTMK